jgi:hypothetical protein
MFMFHFFLHILEKYYIDNFFAKNNRYLTNYLGIKVGSPLATAVRCLAPGSGSRGATCMKPTEEQ